MYLKLPEIESMIYETLKAVGYPCRVKEILDVLKTAFIGCNFESTVNSLDNMWEGGHIQKFSAGKRGFFYSVK